MLPGELAKVEGALACPTTVAVDHNRVCTHCGAELGGPGHSVCGSDCAMPLLGILEGETSEMLEICILPAGCSVGLRGFFSLEAPAPVLHHCNPVYTSDFNGPALVYLT